jgi:hypothetical protein
MRICKLQTIILGYKMLETLLPDHQQMWLLKMAALYAVTCILCIKSFC